MDIAIAARMALISDMTSKGVLATRIEAMKMPALLLMHSANDYLLELQAQLNRTRRKHFTFALNGRSVIAPRSCAIALVKAELAMRMRA